MEIIPETRLYYPGMRVKGFFFSADISWILVGIKEKITYRDMSIRSTSNLLIWK